MNRTDILMIVNEYLMLDVISGKVTSDKELVNKMVDKLASQLEPPVSWICARHSKIHNIGLFTDKPIKAGQRIYFDAPEIPEAAYLLLSKALGEKEKGLFLTTDDKYYDIRNSLLRYMNHSDRPNIDWENGLYIYALRDILSGEELTINYGWDKYDW